MKDMVLAAVNGKHIAIKRPSVTFSNRKGRDTLNCHAAIDYSYRFFDIVKKWPGSMCARIFANSSLNEAMRNGIIHKCEKVTVPSEDPVLICILRDTAYPLLPFLMAEYATGGKSPDEKLFGFRLSSARMVIECPFGRLKARFGCLRQNMDIRLEELPVVIHSCFILHNFCERKKEPVNQHRVAVARKYDTEFQPSLGKYQVVKNNESGGKKI